MYVCMYVHMYVCMYVQYVCMHIEVSKYTNTFTVSKLFAIVSLAQTEGFQEFPIYNMCMPKYV